MQSRDPRLQNKWWRITHLYKILDKEGNLVTFKPSRVQKFILSKINHRFRARILKYRQGGVTTLFCILYLDEALWTPGFSAAIIAHEREALDKIFGIIKRAYENIPENIKPKTRQDTLRRYSFEQTADGQPLDSEIYVALKLRGGTVQALHITERAYIEGEKSSELEAGSKQAVPMTGRITEETTANGFNEYHDSFMDDLENPSESSLDYISLFIPWHQDPQYTLEGTIEELSENDAKLRRMVQDMYGYELTDGQILWYNWKEKDLTKAARESDEKIGLSGRQLMRQEYPSTLLEAFQSGAGNVFDPEILQTYKPAEVIETIKSKEVPGHSFRVLKAPVPNKFYTIGCDPSDGSQDPAGIAVWSEDFEKCAEWSGLLRPDNLAKMIKEMGDHYNNAFAGVENNMLSTILFLSKIYENYFITRTIDKRTSTSTKKIGWSTTGKSRDLMIDEFTMHFEEQSLGNLSEKTLKEMQTFVVKEGGKREHAVGKHDDMLFSDMIAIQMLKYKNKQRKRTRVFANKAQGF